MKYPLLILSFISIGFSLNASAQITEKAYHVVLDAATCEKIRPWDTDCKSPFSGLLDVTIQIDQMPSTLTLIPRGSLVLTGDVDRPSQMVNQCVYEYSGEVARATLLVKTSEGKLIASSQQNLTMKRQAFVKVEGSDTSCDNPPKEKLSMPLQVIPRLSVKIQEKMALDLKLSPMEINAGVQSVDEKTGAQTLSGLTLTPSNAMAWRISSGFDSMARGQVRIPNN